MDWFINIQVSRKKHNITINNTDILNVVSVGQFLLIFIIIKDKYYFILFKTPFTIVTLIPNWIAIIIDPNYAPAYVFRGNAYSALKNYAEAIIDYTKGITIDPEYTYGYQARGDTYVDLENYEDAIADYTRAIIINPEYKYAYLSRGDVYDDLELYEEALADFTKAVRIDPDYTVAYNNRGIVFGKKENYNEAIADFNRAIRINPDYTNAYANRGFAKELAGLSYCSDYKKACDLGEEWCCESYNEDCK